MVSFGRCAVRCHETGRDHAPAGWTVASLIRRWAGRIQRLRSGHRLASSRSTAAAGNSEPMSNSELVRGSEVAALAGLVENGSRLAALSFGSRIAAARAAVQAPNAEPVRRSRFDARFVFVEDWGADA